MAPAFAAFDYFDRCAIDESSRVVSAATWLPRGVNGAAADVPMYEHAGAGAVFSSLWMPHAP